MRGRKNENSDVSVDKQRLYCVAQQCQMDGFRSRSYASYCFSSFKAVQVSRKAKRRTLERDLGVHVCEFRRSSLLRELLIEVSCK
jgi:hypothetical protein